MENETIASEPCEFCNGNGCPICDESFVDEPDYPEEHDTFDEEDGDFDGSGRAPDINPYGGND